MTEFIWQTKYQFKDPQGNPIDKSIQDTWRRVAKAVASVETTDELKKEWEEKFYDILTGFKFLPGGRILASAGTNLKHTTMFNCYVLDTIEDSLEGIFDAVKSAALTQKQGGGVGMDFSTLRPSGEYVKGVNAHSSGPLSFMRVFDSACQTILSAGQRRGAQIAVLRCDHPDILSFIKAKQDGVSFRMFNLSVAITDAFMEAVQLDTPWELKFGDKVYKVVKAKELWKEILESTYTYAEPGVLFVDTINKKNNLWYCETIASTNPCGEIPLPPNGACLLGSINLTQFVDNAFEPNATVLTDKMLSVVRSAVRFLDNVIEISKYPLKEQSHMVHNTRRMGLGVTGLADMLAMLRLKYSSQEGRDKAEQIMSFIRGAAYQMSSELAAEKGTFPLYDAEKYLKGEFVRSLDPDNIADIKKHGIRNSHLIAIAPTGTTSLLAGNVSSGVEPIFSYSYTRKVRQSDDAYTEEKVEDYAARLYKEMYKTDQLPEWFQKVSDLSVVDHISMQAVLQKLVDSSISKTINVPEDFPFDAFKNVYEDAYAMGLKGCTTYRPNHKVGSILSESSKLRDAHKPPRPEYLACDIKEFRSGSKPWVCFVGLYDGRPFEIFAGQKEDIELPKKWTTSETRQRKLSSGNRYDLYLNRGTEQEIIIRNIPDQFKETAECNSQTRMVSLGLGHGIPVKEVCEQLERDLNPDLSSFNKCIMRVLKHYIKDGELSGDTCENCGSRGTLVYREGCKYCNNCGDSKCK